MAEKQEYKTIASEEKKYGTKNFIEIAIKEIDGNKFYNIAKGYYNKDGTKVYKTSIGFPHTEEMKDFVADSLKKLKE